MTHPPRLFEAVARRLLPPDVVGDLREGFARRAAAPPSPGTRSRPTSALRAARAWYRRQVLAHVARLPRSLVEGGRRGPATPPGRPDMLLQDLRHGLRGLARRPALSAVVVATLAVAIAANATAFSLWDALFARPLPVEEPDRLVGIYGSQPGATGTAAFSGYLPVSWLTVRDLADQTATLDGVWAVSQLPVSLGYGDRADRAVAHYVTAELFDILGVEPALGRGFRPEEDDDLGGGRLAILSHGFWTERMGADPTVLDRTITVNGQAYDVVGVAPASFTGTAVNAQPDLWVPISAFAARSDWGPYLEERSARFFTAGGRVAAGVSLEEAERDLMRVADRMAEEYPDTYGTQRLQMVRMAEAAVTPNVQGIVRGGTRAIMGLAALVLLIACMNVANVLLVRALGREREMAIRTSVGAARGRLLVQVLVETLVLFSVGGLVGVALAAWAQGALAGVRPPMFGGNALELRLDLPVMAFTVGVTLVAALVFGLVPAVRASDVDVSGALREGSRGSTGRRSWSRNGLVLGQVTLSLVALVAAGLFVRALIEAGRTDLGFRPAGLGTLSVDLGAQGYTPEEGIAFYRRVQEALEAEAGIDAVAIAQYKPLAGSAMMPVARLGVPFEDPSSMTYVRVNPVTPSYAETVGLRVAEGRWLSASDGADDATVIVVNRYLAEILWPDQDAVGQILQVGPDGHEASVVGVVPTGRYLNVDEDPMAVLYTPLEQTYPGTATIFVRGRGSAEDALPLAAARRVVARVDPGMPVYDVEPATALVDQSLWNTRALAWLMGGFGATGLLLAALGIYGVVSHTVRERRREMGLRKALGADPRSVLLQMLFGGLGVVLVGTGAGLVLAGLLSRRLAPQLHGVSPTDPLTYAVVTASLLIVALVAALLPSLRAARVDPLETLREL